ncbi:hypothetical protein ABIF73_009476 [Bradyrhizobium japonicum]
MSNRTSDRRMAAAEREARKVFRDTSVKPPVSEHEGVQQAFRATGSAPRRSGSLERLQRNRSQRPDSLKAVSASGLPSDGERL